VINKISDRLDRPKRDFIYDILPSLNPRLCVDVGAAMGSTAKKMHDAVAPRNGTVIAFEPFPGNFPFLSTLATEYPDVDVRTKAVSDTTGWEVLVVPQTVSGAEKGWEHLVGYSSTGMLSSAWGKSYTGLAAECWLRHQLGYVAGLVKGNKPRRLRVETTTLDHEFKGQHIDFVKIDVQGTEGRVLAGAEHLLRSGAIDLMYIEWSGEPQVVDLLTKHRYHCFDSTYLCGTDASNLPRLEGLGLMLLDDANLSTGKLAYELVLRGPHTPAYVIDQVNRYRRTFIQTDLIAVSGASLSWFEKTLTRLPESR
jgi:FkbM family methyltransferase